MNHAGVNTHVSVDISFLSSLRLLWLSFLLNFYGIHCVKWVVEFHAFLKQYVLFDHKGINIVLAPGIKTIKWAKMVK